jgi:hypothetical protein
MGEYLPGDFYYAGVRYDSAGTRYSKVGLFNPQLKLMWQFTTPNNDADLKLWPIGGEQYISVKQNGRILKFNANGFIDSMYSVQYAGMQWLFVRDFGKKSFVFSPWEAQWKNLFHDTLILVKCDLQGNTQSTYKYYQKEGLIYYSKLIPSSDGNGYQLRFLTNTGSSGGYKYGYRIITLDSNLSEVQVKELDTALVNKYYDDDYYFTTYARLKHGFATLERPRTPDGQISNGFIIDVYNDNWELQHQTYITDSIIKANSKEYKSFDVRPWVVDVVKTSKDSGLIIGGFYKVGMFPYETLPFLIKTDTAGRVVWLDAGVGDFPTGVAEPKPVTEHLVLYPNPATTVFTIETNAAIQNIELFDITGRQIPIHVSKDIETYNVSFSSLPAGVYLLKYRNVQGENYVKKILIE